MANELSLNQTVQGEVGEFNYLYVNQEEVDIQAINLALTTLDQRVTQNETNIQTLADSIGTINENISTLNGAVNNIVDDISDLREDRDDMRDDIADLDTRVSALEGGGFDSSIVDNLSLSVQALQTRTGTLESLIGLLTNNNTNDTAIEHRISRLEKTITALKSIYDAKRAVYNIPVDW